MDFLDVDRDTLDVAQLAPGASYSKEGFCFMQSLDLRDELFVDDRGLGISGLVVSGGSGEIKPLA